VHRVSRVGKHKRKMDYGRSNPASTAVPGQLHMYAGKYLWLFSMEKYCSNSYTALQLIEGKLGDLST